MANRKIETQEKVDILKKCLRLKNVKKISKEYGVDKQSIYNWLGEILESLPEVLKNERPGPKPKKNGSSTPLF